VKVFPLQYANGGADVYTKLILLPGPVQTRSIRFRIPTQTEKRNEYAIQMVSPNGSKQ